MVTTARTPAEIVAQDRLTRGVIAVEIDAEFLPQFIEFLNDAHIVKDGYLHQFGAYYYDDATAVIDETIRTFNED